MSPGLEEQQKADRNTASSAFLMASADKMLIHPQFIMDHLAKLRTKKGEPLLCFIMNLSIPYIEVIDTLLELGLPMYEAITPDINNDFYANDDSK